ncbi:MAG TPA: 8-amino-7-oxononanoate synthase [Planctomycetaceae bacterium]|nr:8-amino-7-oxononanoate synthase [Planctomycetaceae bacterium]
MSNDSFQQRLETSLRKLESVHQRRMRRSVEVVSTTECIVDGRHCISFATNDYLGLTRHSSVVAAFAAAAAKQAGAGASALIAGRSPFHMRLEEAIAKFEATQSALLFPSGFAANMGTLTSLIGERDAVFCDRDNHASLIDGCRASAGRLLIYDRRELSKLGDSIARRRQDFDATFIVTDSVFSMDGTLADLPQLCDVADRFDATLIVDEAHGTGVFGATGRGVCELQAVEDRVPVKIGTLSKAIGGLGGFVTGSNTLCEWLWNSARSQFFSTALPPAVCAAAEAALQVIADEPQRRATLAAQSMFARQLLMEAEMELIPAPAESPIIGVLLRDDDLVVRVSQRMMVAGFFIPAVRPPTVAAGTARLRMSLSCDHDEDQIRSAVYQLREVVQSERR